MITKLIMVVFALTPLSSLVVPCWPVYQFYLPIGVHELPQRYGVVLAKGLH